jgi:hypothetical protein
MLVASLGFADDQDAIGKAQAAAADWLALTDSGKYDASWQKAAALFQAAITQEEWVKALTRARSSFGDVKSRKVKSSSFTRTLPGAPDGEYVVIEFDSRFANKAAAVETVTPMREKDGSWKVSGYFIR